MTDTVNRDDRKQGNYITLEGHLSNRTLKHPSATKWGMRSFLLLKRKVTIRSLNKRNNIARVERLLLGDALHSTDVHRSFSISSYDEISKCMKTIMLQSVLQSNQIYMDLFIFFTVNSSVSTQLLETAAHASDGKQTNSKFNTMHFCLCLVYIPPSPLTLSIRRIRLVWSQTAFNPSRANKRQAYGF